MGFKLLSTIAVLAAAAALPAAGEPSHSANINAAYERGKASSAQPQTVDEIIRCAAYWYVWDKFRGEVNDEAKLSGFDPALRGAQPEAALLYWEDEVYEVVAALGYDEVQIMDMADRSMDEAWNVVGGMVSRGSYGYAEILGTCALPAQEG